MGVVTKIISGTGLLICIYLLVAYGKNSASIISSIGSLYTGSIKTLQGR